MPTSTNTASTAPAKKTLGWPELNKLGTCGSGNRWFPGSDIAEYFEDYRTPSGAWPYSFAKAAMTVKFAKWLKANKPELAASVGLQA